MNKFKYFDIGRNFFSIPASIQKKKTMKILKAILLLTIIASCTTKSSEEIFDTDISGTWELTRMTGSFKGSETQGSDMDWQESYRFNTNATYTKTRHRGGETFTATGRFSYIEDEEVEFLYTLTYGSESIIIGNCSGNKSESLYIINGTLHNTWNMCDGPGLEYKKIND